MPDDRRLAPPSGAGEGFLGMAEDEDLRRSALEDVDPVLLRCSMVVVRDDSVLLCRRTHAGDTWVLPGGSPRRGEGTASAATRETVEETGITATAESVLFVLETTSWDKDHHLIEIVFLGVEKDRRSSPTQLEEGLVPSFVPIRELARIPLRPPIGGYVKGYALRRQATGDPRVSTAAYLGNVWRPEDAAEPGG